MLQGGSLVPSFTSWIAKPGGYGSKLDHQGTASFSPCFRLPGQAFWVPVFDPQPGVYIGVDGREYKGKWMVQVSVGSSSQTEFKQVFERSGRLPADLDMFFCVFPQGSVYFCLREGSPAMAERSVFLVP